MFINVVFWSFNSSSFFSFFFFKYSLNHKGIMIVELIRNAVPYTGDQVFDKMPLGHRESASMQLRQTRYSGKIRYVNPLELTDFLQ